MSLSPYLLRPNQWNHNLRTGKNIACYLLCITHYPDYTGFSQKWRTCDHIRALATFDNSWFQN